MTRELAYVVAVFVVVFVVAMLFGRWLRTRSLERVELELEDRRRRLERGDDWKGRGDR